MTVEHTGVRLKLEHKHEEKNKDSRKQKAKGNKKKGKYLPPPSHEALMRSLIMGRDSGEGRTVVVLLKGLYL